MILHFVNILPNIYWFFIGNYEKHINNSLVSNRIKQFCKLKNINKIIRLDQIHHIGINIVCITHKYKNK